MIRFGLLGGMWGPLPWELFATLGGACLGAAAFYARVESPWVPGRTLELVVMTALLVPGLSLLGVSVLRRHASRRGRA